MCKQDHENAFIDAAKERLGSMTNNTEVMLRYGFSAGFVEAYALGLRAGREQKRREFTKALEPDSEGLL